MLALRAGAGDAGDWDRFVRHANAVLGEPGGTFDADGTAVRDAVSLVLAEMAKRRPELQFTSVGA
jgi:hypothetical protein